MLSDTQSLGTTVVTFTKTGYINNGTGAIFAPTGDTPSTQRNLKVSHEVAKSGKVINTLYAVSHVKADPSSTTGGTATAAVQVKIIRPSFVTDADMKTIIDQVKTGLTSGVQDQLLGRQV